MADAAILPAGHAVRLKLDRDGAIKRIFVGLTAIYLIVALALPLYAMLSKSFVTYSFDLSRYEFQVSDESGTVWSDAVSAEALNERLGKFDASDLASSTDGRLSVTDFFPDFSFRSPVKYRIRGTVDDAPYLVGLDLQNTTEWREFDSNTFRRTPRSRIRCSSPASRRR